MTIRHLELAFSPTVIAAVVVAVVTWNASWAADDDPVVASINGTEIRRSQVKEAHNQLPEQYRKVPLEIIFPNLVDSLIDARLAAADARAKNIHSETEVVEQLARMADQLLQRVVLTREIQLGMTDVAIRSRYNEMVKSPAVREEVHVRQILVKTKTEARAIIGELENGTDFVALAKKQSTGPSASQGGDLGYFGHGQMMPEFEKAAFALDKGQFSSTPVKTQFGWHVIRMDNRRDAEPPKFEHVEQQIRDELSQQIADSYIKRLRQEAEIRRFNINGTPVKAGATEQ